MWVPLALMCIIAQTNGKIFQEEAHHAEYVSASKKDSEIQKRI